MDDIGPIPGRFPPNADFSSFKYLTPKFQQYLNSNALMSKITNFPYESCILTACQVFLIKGVAFIQKINAMYPTREKREEEFLEERPDFYLGRFFSMFADIIFDSFFPFKDQQNFSSKADDLIYTMVQDYFWGYKEGILETVISKSTSCSYIASQLYPEHFDTFMELIKYSHFGFEALSSDEKKYFEAKYVNSSIFPFKNKIEEPKYLKDQKGLIPFCEIAPLYKLASIFHNKSIDCKYFEPILTAKGICYSFNSMSPNELFKASTVASQWVSNKNLQQSSNILRPTGYGKLHGLNFLLNSFEIYSKDRSSNNFLLSITNEHNGYDIFKQNYVLKPGYAYTYKVIANQILTTDRFDSLDQTTRDCSLPGENEKMNLTKLYSKSNCEYECTIRNARTKTNCAPWNIPRFFENYSQICPFHRLSSFSEEMETFSANECNCPSDCFGTSFSVFESRIPLEYSDIDCKSFQIVHTKRDYPNYVFCDLCRKIVKSYKARFLYNYIVKKNEPNPDHWDTFCDTLLTQNVALVKVEMATKSLTRSLKDKRFNFVSQLSSLGKAIVVVVIQPFVYLL
jgi:hypothetical protein